MIFNRFKKIIAGAAIAFALLMGVSVTTANAQRLRFGGPRVVIRTGPRFGFGFGGYYPYGYPYYGYPYYAVDPIAYQKEQGYSQGLKDGNSDAKKGLADNPESHKHFYNSSSMAYRDAFEQGYADGYGRR